MSFSNAVLSILVIASLALSVLVVALLAPRALKVRTVPKDEAIPLDKRLEIAAEAHTRAIQRLEVATRQLAESQQRLTNLIKGSIRNVAVVRFDAFEDMGGRLSFSAALLDAHGDGVVITSINGRQDSRCYAKQVQNGTSIHNLSDEERQAIREALEAPRQVVEAS